MKRATYKKVDSIAKLGSICIALPVCYLGIFFSKNFLVAVLIIFASLLPYVLGYNILVRGWLFRKIED